MRLSRTFAVDAPKASVRDYLADFANAEAWDPGTVRCVRRDVGEVRVGSVWDNTSKLAGNTTELVYELVRLETDTVVLRGSNNSATAEDALFLADLGDGRTQITYQATIRLNGLGRALEPFMLVLFGKIAREVVTNLKRECARL